MRFKTALLAGLGAVAIVALAAHAQVPGVNTNLPTTWTLAYENSTVKPTYSATQGFSPTGSAATDVCRLTGSATKLIKVRRIFFNGMATTAVSSPIQIVKRSTANSGGTAVTPSVVPYDSTYAAGTAVFSVYTANPTVGTSLGLIADPYFSFGNLTTGGAQPFPSVLVYGELGSPIVLRGVAQSVTVNLSGASLSGVVASCTFEWTEE